MPAGKVEADESDTVAMVRELYEETGYKASESELVHLGDFNFGSDDNRYTFVTYKVQLNEQFPLVLESQAHKGYDWVSGKDCYAIPNLITDFHDLLRQLGYVK